MSQNPRTCPYCNQPAVEAQVQIRVRRGERILPVTMTMWECASGCKNESGEKPFRFVDQALAARNDEATAQAWKEAFGEQIPEPLRPGRKPLEKRSRGIRVMLTPSELVAVDRARGALSRSEYIRKFGLGDVQRRT